jgi:hypothetical protein
VVATSSQRPVPLFADPRGNLPGANPGIAGTTSSCWITTLCSSSRPMMTRFASGATTTSPAARADEIFGQLGNDVIQGDGTIGLAAGSSVASSSRRHSCSLARSDGSIHVLPITGFTNFGGGRCRRPRSALRGDRRADLRVRASFEGMYDGDDYIEGNGGNDVIFGNLGQDDIVGGSSTCSAWKPRSERPDGSDLIFGGAGTDIARNDIGDATVMHRRRGHVDLRNGRPRARCRRDHRRQRATSCVWSA